MSKKKRYMRDENKAGGARRSAANPPEGKICIKILKKEDRKQQEALPLEEKLPNNFTWRESYIRA